MHRLTFNLLGRPEVRLRNKLVTDFATTKAEALLYYLACQPGPHPREELADLLWGETPEAKARRSLTQAVSNLRKLVGDVFVVDRLSVGLDETAIHQLDVAVFEDSLTANKSQADVQQLGEAVELYRGDFLEGMYVKGAATFEEWQFSQREQLRIQLLAGLEQLVAAYVAQPHLDIELGLAYARRLLELDPWRETAHRHLMRLLARSGQRGAALAQYDLCRETLADELGAEPMPETTALYERLKAAAEVTLPPLPAETTPFVGRKAELAEINRLLANPNCHLLTLIGLGGIGKTRLALRTAWQVNQEQALLFLNGVVFVPLTSVQTTDALPTAIAKAVGLSLSGASKPANELINHLRHKEMLIVLDNFDHLFDHPADEGVDGTGLLRDILDNCPEIKLLVTSREPLNLTAEWRLDVEGLSFTSPTSVVDHSSDETATLLQLEAAQLFIQAAHQIRPSFHLSPDDIPHLHHLCQLVGGMPLALELAAAWLRVMPIERIVAEIEAGLDILSSRLRDIPPRQRSIRAIFDYSWKLLNEEEKTVFQAMSIFFGGGDEAAARAVTGATPFLLAGLVDRGLLQVREGGLGLRYEMHELTRQYVSEKLDTNLKSELHCRAAAWYEDNNLIIEAVEHALLGQDFERAARLIDATAETTLWFQSQWITLLRWMDALPTKVIYARPKLSLFQGWALFTTGQWEAAREILPNIEQAVKTVENRDERENMLGEVTNIRACVCFESGDMEQCIDFGQQALILLAEDNVVTRGTVKLVQGLAYFARYDLSAARQVFNEAIILGQEADNMVAVLMASGGLAQLEVTQGSLQKTAELYRQARQLGTQPDGIVLGTTGIAYIQMGEVLREWNDLTAARRILSEGIALCQQQMSMPEHVLAGYFTLARVLYAEGNTRAVGEVMTKAEQCLGELRQRSGNVEMIIAPTLIYQLRLWLAQGDLVAVARWAGEQNITVDDDLIQHHLDHYIILGRLHLAQGRVAEASRLFEQLTERLDEGGSPRPTIEVLLLKALALQALDDPGQAVDTLAQALALAETEGYIRLFIDEGEPMHRLLQQTAARAIRPDYVAKLLAGSQGVDPILYSVFD